MKYKKSYIQLQHYVLTCGLMLSVDTVEGPGLTRSIAHRRQGGDVSYRQRRQDGDQTRRGRGCCCLGSRFRLPSSGVGHALKGLVGRGVVLQDGSLCPLLAYSDTNY